MSKPLALSGIKPTGTPHLGNYFGMIQPMLDLRGTHRVFCFIADYHALTTETDPQEIRRYTKEVVATIVALRGDSPVTIFRQSQVPGVHELAWYLSCVTNLGTLQRAHAYKASVAEGSTLNVGTFMYPALMAADILLYGTDVVPVGQDQHQHVQIAQEMANHFNHTYGHTFREPKAWFQSNVVVPGKDGRKMSKSYRNTLPIFATEVGVRKYVREMVTDSTPLSEPKDPTKCPVANLYRLVCPQNADRMDALYRAGGYGYGSAKEELTQALLDRFKEPRERYLSLWDDQESIDSILEAGQEEALKVVQGTLAAIRKKVGL